MSCHLPRFPAEPALRNANYSGTRSKLWDASLVSILTAQGWTRTRTCLAERRKMGIIPGRGADSDELATYT